MVFGAAPRMPPGGGVGTLEIAEDGEQDDVEGRARELLPEVRDGPAADDPVQYEAVHGLITRAKARRGGAANKEAPLEDETPLCIRACADGIQAELASAAGEH